MHGGSNSNHRHVIWFDCHNGKNQGWELDQKGVHFPRYPLGNSKRFQIRSLMKDRRSLYVAEHIGHHQYRLRIQNFNPYDNKQWFVFDWRTKSIRQWSDRNKAMSIQWKGNNWNHNGYAAVVRQFKAEGLQKMRWFSGSKRNIRDMGQRCLDVHGGHNQNKRHVHWYKCHNGKNQAWRIDRHGYRYPR